MGREHISKATPSPDLLLPENESPAVVFGAALRAARECNGETQAVAAAAIGVSKSAYAKYERGEKEPCLIVLKNIMGHYEVDANYLLPLGTQQHNTANAELNAIYRRLCNTFDRLDVLGKDARIMGLITSPSSAASCTPKTARCASASIRATRSATSSRTAGRPGRATAARDRPSAAKKYLTKHMRLLHRSMKPTPRR